MPRWLNEGLAQTFEAGLLEADSLRIDTPNLVALQQLQSDLRGPSPLELVDLLNAGSETFLAAHAGDGKRLAGYYYSWGLAYYLAFDQGVLGTTAVDAYLSPAAAGCSRRTIRGTGRHAARRLQDPLARSHARAEGDVR